MEGRLHRNAICQERYLFAKTLCQRSAPQHKTVHPTVRVHSEYIRNTIGVQSEYIRTMVKPSILEHSRFSKEKQLTSPFRTHEFSKSQFLHTPIVLRLYSDCTPNVLRLYSDCRPVTKNKRYLAATDLCQWSAINSARQQEPSRDPADFLAMLRRASVCECNQPKPPGSHPNYAHRSLQRAPSRGCRRR